MRENSRVLPIGIQSFEKIRSGHNLYVDKTEYIYKLVQSSTPCFLSRPRRFGKSLLLSTLKAYWEGRKELFAGLKIEKLQGEDPWEPYPVFYFDFNRDDFSRGDALENVLDAHLRGWEEIYQPSEKGRTPALRFQSLLECAKSVTGKSCIILIDEYDKPLLETMDNAALQERNRAAFKGFFSTLKSYDDYIRFVFITGVTKFSKVSIFSDLNQLRDISMTAEFADVCGITEEEMLETFTPEIKQLAMEQGCSVEECLQRLRKTYDGYHFHQKGSGVYNPYSLLNALEDREFDSYWFETGTPTFLVKKLQEMQFDVQKFTDGTLWASKRMLKDYRDDNPDLIPLLYQTGYITISGYDPQSAAFTLGFPNEEVKYGFLESLMPAYVSGVGAGSGKDILTLKKYVEEGNLDSIRAVLTALSASIPYTEHAVPFEHYFQTVLYITLTLLGQFVQCEVHTSRGRIDCVIETGRFVYLFEFKRDKNAGEAMKQVTDKQYGKAYSADPRKVYQIGVNFSSKTRELEDWQAQELYRKSH